MSAVEEIRGAPKKEAFHQAAEAGIKSFAFKPEEVSDIASRKVHVKLANTNSCRASVQILRGGGENNLHYHPNMDLIYMVLKGCVRFYGNGNRVLGEYGPSEGILLPENARYWFESVGEEEAHLLQIAGFPKGAAAAKRIPLEAKQDESGPAVWVGLSEAEEEVLRRNKRF